MRILFPAELCTGVGSDAVGCSAGESFACMRTLSPAETAGENTSIGRARPCTRKLLQCYKYPSYLTLQLRPLLWSH